MKIEHENSVFKDIVQGHFIDSYHNLTNKGVMGLKWITEYCQNAEFIVKIDDDVFVNFFKVFSEMSQIKSRKRYITCNILRAGSNRIQRAIYDHWYVHKDEFKRMRYYPYTSCSGLAVFISRDLVPLLYKAAFMSPFFWVDDFYLFGILPAKIDDVIHQRLNMNISLDHTRGLECYEKFGTQCPFVVSQIIPEYGNVTFRSWEAILRNRK
jgi:beta-1,3-galactosyltransferase 1